MDGVKNQVSKSSPQRESNIIRISVSEAARLFGVEQKTIRRAIKSQALRYAVVQGRYKINFESLVKWSQQHVKIKKKVDTQGIGQFVGQWKIRNILYSPNPKTVVQKKSAKVHRDKKGGEDNTP